MKTRINNSAFNAGSIESITSKREALIESLYAFIKAQGQMFWHLDEEKYQKLKSKILSLPAGYSIYILVYRAGCDDRILKAFPEKLFGSYDRALAEHYCVGFKLVAATDYKVNKEFNSFWRKDLNKVTFDHGSIMLTDERL